MKYNRRTLAILGMLALAVGLALYPFRFLQMESAPYYGDYRRTKDAYDVYVLAHGKEPSSLEDFTPTEILVKMQSPHYPLKMDKDHVLVFYMDPGRPLNRVNLLDCLWGVPKASGIGVGKVNTKS